MRTVFMGTPDFAVPCLQRLFDCGCEVCGVFTQPDKPKGRHGVLTAPPVKELALKMGVPVFQPTKMRDGTALEMLKSVQPTARYCRKRSSIIPSTAALISTPHCCRSSGARRPFSGRS